MKQLEFFKIIALEKEKNNNLIKARQVKNDEFYTLYSDIDNEVKHYAEQLRGKIIFCCCDGEHSNFIKYLNEKKEQWGIKEIISSTTDFRGDISIELLEKCDIVITNPPFSLFREFIEHLIYHNKKFLIVGSATAIAYRDIFKDIKDNKLHIGYHYGNMTFDMPNNETKVVKVTWYTNLRLLNDKRIIEVAKLKRSYYSKRGQAEYKRYDNYKALNIDKLIDIPRDYFKPMGVPITYLAQHNAEEFDIIEKPQHALRIRGKELFIRIIIKRN